MFGANWSSSASGKPGTYFTEPGEAGGSAPAVDALVAALARVHRQAQGLGLSDRAFARFVTLFHEPGLRRFPVAVCECNREQCGMIAREVAEATGAPTRQVLLADLCARPEAAVGAIGGVVTTDCHREEVTQALRGLRLPVHRIALERAFTDELVHHAQRGRVVMIVSDARYGPIFARTLGQLSVAARVIPSKTQTRTRFGSPCGLDTIYNHQRPKQLIVGLRFAPAKPAGVALYAPIAHAPSVLSPPPPSGAQENLSLIPKIRPAYSSHHFDATSASRLRPEVHRANGAVAPGYLRSLS